MPSGPATAWPTATAFEWAEASTSSPGVNPEAVMVASALGFTTVGVITADSGSTGKQFVENSVVTSFAGDPLVAVVNVATSGVPIGLQGDGGVQRSRRADRVGLQERLPLGDAGAVGGTVDLHDGPGHGLGDRHEHGRPDHPGYVQPPP